MSGFSNYETAYFDTERGLVCSYCGNEQLEIDDSFDEYGNYQGTRNYCTCSKAKLEQEMKQKISVLTKNGMLDLISEVREEYLPKLAQDNSIINEKKFEGEFSEFIKDSLYSKYTSLQAMSNSELLKKMEEIVYEIRYSYERRQPDDTFDKDDITVKISSYGANFDLWEVYVLNDTYDEYTDLNKEGFTSRDDAEGYVEELKSEYNITIKD